MKLKSLLKVIEANEIVDICVPDKLDPEGVPRTIYYGEARNTSSYRELVVRGYLDDQVKWVVSYVDHPDVSYLNNPDEEIFEEYSVIMIVLPENRTD